MFSTPSSATSKGGEIRGGVSFLAGCYSCVSRDAHKLDVLDSMLASVSTNFLLALAVALPVVADDIYTNDERFAIPCRRPLRSIFARLTTLFFLSACSYESGELGKGPYQSYYSSNITP